jgi:hypothetical protein
MKVRPLYFAIALIVFGVTLCSAQVEATMGTWRVNEAKSKLPDHLMHINSDTYEAQGDQIRVTSDATGPDGKHLNIQWIGKFDGKDYPCSCDPSGDLRSYRPVDGHTIVMTKKKDGKTGNPLLRYGNGAAGSIVRGRLCNP